MAQLDKANVELGLAEEPTLTERPGSAESLRFPEPLLILAKRKSFIFKFVSAAAILVVAIVLLLPNTYTADTKIMPPQQNQPMSTTAILSQLGPLAALAGQGLGLRTPSDLYVSMLRSDRVADAIIDRFSLMSVYNKKRRVDTRKQLQDRTLVNAAKDGIITVSVEDRDSQRAADLANAYVEELEKLTRTLAVTEAAQRRAFFEHETKMAMDDLANAEQGLKETQEKTGLILLEPQSRTMLEAVTSLRARVAAQEIIVRSMRSFAAPENPDLIRAEEQLSAMKDQVAHLERGQGRPSVGDLPIENVPTAGLEYIRKLREVKYREALFELLAKQYEAAKIDEARDALIVQQLDSAKKPEKKSGPLRAIIVLSTILLASLVAFLAAFFLERFELAKEEPQFASQLQLFKFYLRPRRS